MTDDIRPLLGAYHDGELGEADARRVKEHLLRCQACRTELAALEGLSGLLAGTYALPQATPPARFAAQVALRLPKRPEMPAWHRLLQAAWWSVPVLLLLAWAEVQALLVTSAIVVTAVRLGFGGSELAALLPGASAPARPGQGALRALFGSQPADVVVLLPLALLVLAVVGAFAYWGWLASWQARPGRVSG